MHKLRIFAIFLVAAGCHTPAATLPEQTTAEEEAQRVKPRRVDIPAAERTELTQPLSAAPHDNRRVRATERATRAGTESGTRGGIMHLEADDPLGGLTFGGVGDAYGAGHVAKLKRQSRRARYGFQAARPPMNREGYAHITENDFHDAKQEPLSTFSIDVDTASYANVRRMLNANSRPPAGAVRIEEFLNYFSYEYPKAAANEPFSVYTEVADCPWKAEHKLLHIGIQARKVDKQDVPASNLVFLIDVSGSMSAGDKLGLLKQGLAMLARQLREQDHVAIVAYAGASGLVLPSTSGARRGEILAALERLEAGGSTNGGAGIELAYSVAAKHFIKGGVNRVILATDGDFNVGLSSDDALKRLIENKRKSGVFLSVLGFGTGNYQDAKMETLADAGNGNYAYIDSLREANKVLVREAGSTLVTIAKDVKLQLEFNPAVVQSYRLVGYENRKLAARDFNDDKKDAGEIGAGHTVTALYEIVPVGVVSDAVPSIDPLRYQKPQPTTSTEHGSEMLTIKVRHKAPAGAQSRLQTWRVADRSIELAQTSADFRFAAAVAEFGMLLRDSTHRGTATFAHARQLAVNALGRDVAGDRAEFLSLLVRAQSIVGEQDGDDPIAGL